LRFEKYVIRFQCLAFVHSKLFYYYRFFTHSIYCKTWSKIICSKYIWNIIQFLVVDGPSCLQNIHKYIYIDNIYRTKRNMLLYTDMLYSYQSLSGLNTSIKIEFPYWILIVHFSKSESKFNFFIKNKIATVQ